MRPLFDRLLRPACETSTLELPLRLTLLEILLRPMGFWAIRPFLLLLAILGLLKPQVLKAPATWIALSLLVGWRLVDDWPLPDNHIYLLFYWCLTLFLALGSMDCNRIASRSSRLLIGFAFGFAALWKGYLSDDYIDQRFFRVTFFQDDRFAHTSMLFGDLTEKQLMENRSHLNPLPEGAELLHPPVLTEPPEFQMLVWITTWGTLALEFVIALVMFLPIPEKLRMIRHILLLFFCIVTYAFAPVAGFGWLVLVMGLAQCKGEQKILRYSYLCAYLLVLLYSEIPWSQLVFDTWTKVQ